MNDLISQCAIWLEENKDPVHVEIFEIFRFFYTEQSEPAVDDTSCRSGVIVGGQESEISFQQN